MKVVNSSYKEPILKNLEILQGLVTFAETKNSAIIGTAGAVVAFMYEKVGFSNFNQMMFSIGYIFLSISLVIAFWSFFPINFANLLNSRAMNLYSDTSKNMFLFSDIASFSSQDDYIEAVSQKYYKNDPISPIDEDFLQQMFTLSHIVVRKMNLFKHSIRFFFIGAILIAIFAVVSS